MISQLANNVVQSEETYRHIWIRVQCILRHRHTRSCQVCSYTSSVPHTSRYVQHTRLRLQDIKLAIYLAADSKVNQIKYTCCGVLNCLNVKLRILGSRIQQNYTKTW